MEGEGLEFQIWNPSAATAYWKLLFLMPGLLTSISETVLRILAKFAAFTPIRR